MGLPTGDGPCLSATKILTLCIADYVFLLLYKRRRKSMTV